MVSKEKKEVIIPINTVRLFVREMAICSKHTHTYAHTCAHQLQHFLSFVFPILSYAVYEIGDPYVTYQINVTVEQVSHTYENNIGQVQEVWSTIGYAIVGQERIGQNTNHNQDGDASGPMVG